MAIDSILANAASQVAGAIRKAAQSTGTSFEYLLTTARIESNLNPAAQAATTSAKGLYQFIEQTWLGTMKHAGPAIGYGQYGDAITRGEDGRYQVSDPGQYKAIMQLRSDPATSAMLAGAFTRANGAQLSNAIGRQPSEGELYIAHFLGSDGAAKLIGAASARPQASAAAMFPQAASANRSIFYDSAGNARSALQVYGKITSRYEFARSLAFDSDVVPPVVPVMSAPNPSPQVVTDTREPIPPPVVPVMRTPSPPPPDTAGVTQAFARADIRRPPVADTRPMYQSMFTDRAPGPVTATVTSLWGQSAGNAPSAPQARPLDLFTDVKPPARKL